MYANIVINDEFEASQANTCIRNLTEIKCQLWVTDVHGDLNWNIRQHTTGNFSDFSFDQTIVDMAFITLCARNCHHHAVLQMLGSIATTHYCRNTQLTSNNRSMTSTTTTISDNRSGTFHHRLPVWVRHISNQYITGLNAIHFAGVSNNTNRACANLLTNCTAFSQYLRATLQLVAHLYLASSLALDCLWTGLQDINPAILTVFTPLNIHWTTVVFFDNDRVFCQLGNICIFQRKAIAFFWGDINGLYFLCRACWSKLHLN